MASTIKLKSSTTAGNAPSSLETGEFAINVKDGNLFYGSASAVLQNFVIDELEVKGNLTAQQYIVSSSVVYTTQSFSSGSTAFGDSADDTHVFIGDTTVSGDISASGFVIGNRGQFSSQVEVNGEVALSTTDSATTGQVFADTQITKIKIGKAGSITSTLLESNVTASGNISSSGTIVASNLSGTNTGDQDLSSLATIVQLNASSSTLQTNIDTKVDTSGTPADNQIAVFTDADTIEGSDKLLFDSSQLDVVSTNNAGQSVRIYGGVYGAVTPYITPIGSSTLVFGDGTSGHIFDFRNNKISFDADSTNTYIQADTSNPENLEIHADGNIELRADDNLEIHGPISTAITASSNISSSGTITATSFTGNGSNLTNLPSQTDENFTTADHSKLDGIEASADVTDTTNVTAAGALMDSEVTNLAQVKAFDSSDYATAAQGSTADSAQQPPSEGAFANGDKTKLDGIEASADVTDTANVQSALNNQSLDIGSGTLTANTIDSTTDIDITTNNEFLRGKTTGGATRNVIGISSDNRVEVGNTTVGGLELIADPAITASCDVISGSAIVQLKPRLELPKTSTTDADYYGTVVYFGTNASGMTAGTIYYYRDTGAWVSTQADSTTTSLGLLGVALGAAASDGVLIQGTVTLNHDPGALGDTLYLSDTNAGLATSTVPSSTNDVVRVVGYCLDASNGQIYFNPSSDHIVHA